MSPLSVGVVPETQVNFLPRCGKMSTVPNPGVAGLMPSTSSFRYLQGIEPQGWHRLVMPHWPLMGGSLCPSTSLADGWNISKVVVPPYWMVAPH